MRTCYLWIIGFGCLASLSLAQSTPQNDPVATLKAKQAQREAERAQKADITVGDLEDLRALVKKLQAENAGLRKQLADAGANKTPKKHFTKIELGMTRDELESFIQQHQSEYKILGMSASTGTHKRAIQTTINRQDAQTVNRQGQTNTNTTVNGSNPQVRGVGEESGTNINTGTVVKENVEQQVDTGQKETLTVGVLEKVAVKSGYHTDVLGRRVPDYGSESRIKSTFAVELTDGVVTSVVASAR